MEGLIWTAWHSNNQSHSHRVDLSLFSIVRSVNAYIVIPSRRSGFTVPEDVLRACSDLIISVLLTTIGGWAWTFVAKIDLVSIGSSHSEIHISGVVPEDGELEVACSHAHRVHASCACSTCYAAATTVVVVAVSGSANVVTRHSITDNSA
jgi:hypothetical protein